MVLDVCRQEYRPATSAIDPRLCLGTRDGHFRRYPAAADERDEETGDPLIGGCRPYDPRGRPWYVAASMGPKDVVLVVDTSESMNALGKNGRSRWDVTKRAVLDILSTMTPAQYVNIIPFSDSAEPLWKGEKLAQGSRGKIKILRSRVEKTFPRGGTHFENAIRAAFRLLTDGCKHRKPCSNCHKVILFLTDGKDTSGVDGESIKPSKMVKVIAKLQHVLKKASGVRASIFTYSIMEDADDAMLRQIACANNGAWSFVGADSNTFDVLNPYYLYFAAGRPQKPVWMGPYKNDAGSGKIATVSVPFYSKGTPNVRKVFLGVVGLTIKFESKYERSGMTYEEVMDVLVSHSSECTGGRAKPCEMQVYRVTGDARAQCPDILPDGDEETCFALNGSFYKRIETRGSWKEARQICRHDGGEILSIRDASELAFVSSLASRDGSWIGAQKNAESKFTWQHGSVDNLSKKSSFWGVQEPVSEDGRDECVAMDNRGVIANLMVKECSEELTVICQYATQSACPEGRVRHVPSEGYFEVPPVGLCHPEEVLQETEPVDDVKRLKSNDVLCELGEEKSDKQRICCDGDGDWNSESEPAVKKAWFWVVLTIAFVLVVGAFLYIVWYRRRNA